MISVIICTHNRSDFLKLALESLKKQSVLDFEIIIIDNNSTDATKLISEQYILGDKRIKYVFESKVGLSNARNRGIGESSGSYIAYVDDDCVIPCEWVQKAYKVIDKKSPDIFGGSIIPFYMSTKVSWYKDEYATFHFGEEAKELERGLTLFGGNIFIERSVFDKVGLFRTDLGMIGDQIMYAEESELQLRYLRLIPTGGVYYDPELFVQHYLRPEKMTLKWNIKAFVGKGKSNFMKNKANGNNISKMALLSKLIVSVSKITGLIGYGLVFRSRAQYPYFENFVMERMSGHFKKWGWIIAQL
jgi:glycosyltransferase involved in cell wall biosynthesis